MDPIEPTIEKKSIDRLFLTSMVIKAGTAIFAVCSGVASLFLTTNEVLYATRMLVQGELAADPGDMFANYILDLAAKFTPGQTNLFLFAYLVGHGVINMFLIVVLLRKKLWAYPLTIFSLILFIAYQVYRYTVRQSVFILWLTVFDIIMIALTYMEYSSLKVSSWHK